MVFGRKHKNIAFAAIKFQLLVYVSGKRKIPKLKADRRQLLNKSLKPFLHRKAINLRSLYVINHIICAWALLITLKDSI